MRRFLVAAVLAAFTVATPVSAQIRTVDPNTVMNGSAAAQSDTTPYTPAAQATQGTSDAYTPPATQNDYAPENTAPAQPQSDPYATPAQQNGTTSAPVTTPNATVPNAADDAENGASTYQRDDLITAAEGVFGKGAKGLADIIEKILKDQGQPDAYIAGREAAGAFVVGLRYGSGILYHKIEGQKPVYWTGPSVGFDVGGDATKVFVLVYNLYDSNDLYKRFPAVEGRAYFVGGFSASYLRRGNVVLIPVRLGVGWRLGANIGYMKFTKKHKWLPF
ncbi:hypothetical protein GCM10023219_32360 [Stakelama sediminis]|uniref:DUF1134 domain-containing protein n=1 Tax=Stakelama sediminis TaxID=463200 RepID=A0A840Z1K7_9SPHN|nr:DUF1134 domain-containing protein [Stakelama sediminis]MBB5719572.1 hypothetical protein [Stakelama sediminis]